MTLARENAKDSDDTQHGDLFVTAAEQSTAGHATRRIDFTPPLLFPFYE